MAATAASSTSEISGDGPVLTLINKRIRALRKKLNRIYQMEQSLSRGKTLNKEQEETLRSKSSVVAGIDELERLRQPLLQAVNEEIQIALETSKPVSEAHESEDRTAEERNLESGATDESQVVSAVADLLNLMYFASTFDVDTLSMAHDNLLTRTHERNCCLTYDYVTDDESAGDPLKEWDLDSISLMGSLLMSRPVHSSSSHKESLQMCVERAKLWLANSNQPIQPYAGITYSGLRLKLNKIMASDYFTTAPEIKAPYEVAAAVGNYNSFQAPLHGSVIPQVGFNVPMEGPAADFQQEESRGQARTIFLDACPQDIPLKGGNHCIVMEMACPMVKLIRQGYDVDVDAPWFIYSPFYVMTSSLEDDDFLETYSNLRLQQAYGKWYEVVGSRGAAYNFYSKGSCNPEQYGPSSNGVYIDMEVAFSSGADE